MTLAPSPTVVTAGAAALSVHRGINATSAPYPRDASIADRFEFWVERRPDAEAVVQGDQSLTYRELDRLANGLAAVLRGHDVGAGTTVAVDVARSPEMLVALLSVAKAGGTYVPLDRRWPPERLRAAIADAGCVRLVRDSGGVDEPVAGIPADTVDAARAAALDTPPIRATCGDDIACINFTSGSTGRAKGVSIPHRGIVRLVHGATYGPLDEHSRVLQVTPVTFDIATWEIWGALLNGGTAVLYPPSVVRLSELGRVIEAGRVTITLLTTALFNLVVEEAPEVLMPVGTITSGGEAHSMRMMAKAVRTYGPGRVVNLYGPTECTCIATWFPVDVPPDLDGVLPIGRPIQNTRTYLLADDATRLCAPGEVGEICLAGDGLAAGYLGLPDRTTAAFVRRIIDGVPERLYRSGDYGWMSESGNIVFDGRRDDQVKINSFRIELGEIAHHLDRSPSVRHGCVAVRDVHGDRSLVAFVVSTGPQVTEDRVQAELANALPHYMVPECVRLCDSFPLTLNGKIDRRALLAAHESSPRPGVLFR